jgi:L-serine dehydratase
MGRSLQVMKESVQRGLIGAERSVSGLAGGDARRLHESSLAGKTISGDRTMLAVARAMAAAEVNACMGRIVAAPTAGSCGVLPGVLLTVAERLGKSDEDLVRALFTAAGFGMVIAQKASISGAAGGCQAECGSAAAMAAAAGVELAGGSPEQSAHAAAVALKSMLGLVCDPVAGLVEVPCVKRNGTAAALALAAIDMALAGIQSAIPADEVIEAMGQVGRALPESLRETAGGGLAATPTAREIEAKIQ